MSRITLAGFTALVALGFMPMMSATASEAPVAGHSTGHVYSGHHYGHRGGYHHYGYARGGYGYNNGCAYGGCGYGAPGGGVLDGITRGFGPM